MYQHVLGSGRRQLGTVARRIGNPPSQQDNANRPQINASLLRRQGPAWILAGGGMGATLHGVYMMGRSLRHLRYI
ncbi:hypothetical protein BDV25DRAFT_140443 [Aspergillus avenaceus]|uniref:Uncharacterized protein n=1 Tax=Aspergillus avenaceus TaxID=36643 RepID=A0A5N6TTU4_ASPAV|nr:hypothetical protein BDV25DRAFT_140443 [Aspergillus avenaceus]